MKWPWTKTKPTRRASRGMMTRGFAAAQVDRLLANWKFDGGFTIAEVTAGLATIRSRSRQMAKDSPHFRRFLQLVAINIVGEGFTLKSTPHDGPPGKLRLDEVAAKFFEYHFWQWCNNPKYCDATGRKTVAQIDRLNAKTWARDGEYFLWIQSAQNPYGMSLRVVRPDACDHTYNTDLSNNRIVRCGVEMDKVSMRPFAYYMHTSPEYAYTIGNLGPLTRIPASEIIHGFTQEDEDQPRGIPWGHASLQKLKMLDEYDRAELTAARDEACSVRSYYAEKGQEDLLSDLTSEDNSDVANALVMEKEPGQAEILPIGWKQEIHTPQHPNRELTPFKASMLKDISSGLGMEYANFCNDWAGVSFSSVRQGTISERDMYTTLQNDMISQSKSPVYAAWLKSFLSLSISGNLPVAKFDKFQEHEFRGRRWMWVDPMKDMKSAEMAVGHGWKTNTQVAADMGTDFDDNCEELRRENVTSAGLSLGPVNPNGGVVASNDTEMNDMQDEEDVMGMQETQSAAQAKQSKPAQKKTDEEAGTVAAVTLNGAQIESAVNVILQLSQGTLTGISAIELLVAVGIKREDAEKMVEAENKKPKVKHETQKQEASSI